MLFFFKLYLGSIVNGSLVYRDKYLAVLFWEIHCLYDEGCVCMPVCVSVCGELSDLTDFMTGMGGLICNSLF